MSWASNIRWYSEHGYRMILLDPLAEILRDRGKKPLEKDWRRNEHTQTELLAWAWRGGLHNLGVALGPNDLVLDVDPRSGGNEGLAALRKDIQFDPYEYPLVETGGGGKHIYMRCSAELPKVPNELTAYPGVEYKHIGQQVVAAGGVHPETGKAYKWLHQPDTVPAPPGQLLDTLSAAMEARETSGSSVIITPEQLDVILALLPVSDYQSHDRWFSLMAAAYHATGGLGVDEFICWSTGDPQYSEHDGIIRTRWQSLERPAANKRSLGTLVYELKKHKVEIPQFLQGQAEQVDTAAVLLKEASNLEKGCPSSRIYEILENGKDLNQIDKELIVSMIAKQTEVSKSTLTKIAKKVKVAPDIPYEVAGWVLEHYFEGGVLLSFANDKKYWRYNKTHWERYNDSQLKGLIKKAAEIYRDNHPDLTFEISRVITAAEIVIRAEVASSADLLGAHKEPNPVVNCTNCEVWIKNDGTVKLQSHDPSSMLTYCLGIEYAPDSAKCDLFDDTLQGIFSPLADCDEVVRHLWEVYGYIIQPQKSIPAWFLLYGTGANGKSVILDVLIALLGPAARSVASIDRLNSTNSDFSLSECVGALAIIDDDVRKDIVLSDDVLKKISEGKDLRTRVPHGEYFDFRNCAVPILAANNWPKTRDLSNGMMRRAYGFPFLRSFAHDDNRKKHIIDHELPGILVKALEGYRRLKKRGKFDVPTSCVELIDEWAMHSNQLLRYLHECHNGGNWQREISLDDIWEGYRLWADKNDISPRKRYTKFGLSESLASMGSKIMGDKQ